jgi:hypothetical protein
LLFLGLPTLLNAPFDWASLGLTRALLRRGIERKGWWLFFLATADALAAAGIIAVLATTMVIGVQAFDDLAARPLLGVACAARRRRRRDAAAAGACGSAILNWFPVPRRVGVTYAETFIVQRNISV